MVSAFILCLFSTHAQVMWNIRKDTVVTYYYQDGDEFSNGNLNEKWSASFGWARSIANNREQQYYSEFKNHEKKDGLLNLQVRKECVTERLVDWMGDKDTIRAGGKFNGFNKRSFRYTSGMISSKNSYLRGYFEMKFKAPKEKGLWPAFWLYGGDPNEEIDFMELKGERHKQVHIDTHCPDRCDHYTRIGVQMRSFGGWVKISSDLTEGFHIISGSWDENEIKFYLNGNFIGVAKVKFDQKKFLVVNIAVPANNGPFKPGPDTTVTQFSPLSIDYIRVWSKTEPPAKPKIINVSEVSKYKVSPSSPKRLVKLVRGKKQDAENEGIFVSLIKNPEEMVQVYCNGLKANESCRLKLGDPTGKILFEQDLDQYEFTVPGKILPGYRLEISYLDKKAEHIF
jgi:hypothetical protein